MPAHAETVGSTTVWADTTRLYPMGQEGGLTISGATFRAADDSGVVVASMHTWPLSAISSISTPNLNSIHTLLKDSADDAWYVFYLRRAVLNIDFQSTRSKSSTHEVQ